MQMKRQDILETALRLFECEGYQSVGIDRIIAESGVAKMTMYKHFHSKDELIIAVLREKDRRILLSLHAFVERHRTFRSRVKAVFLWHNAWFNSPAFNGCMFAHAAAEFREHTSEIRRVGEGHKFKLENLLVSLLAQANPAMAQEMAGQFMLLLEGARISAYLRNRRDSALLAWRIAESLLAAQI